MNDASSPVLRYIWALPGWPDLRLRPQDLAPLIERVAALAGELGGLRAGLSDADQLDSLAAALGEEAAASFAIEGERLGAFSVSASVAASLTAQNRSRVAGGEEAIAALMLDAQTNPAPLTPERLHHWHRLLFERSGRLRRVREWRDDEMRVVSGAYGRERVAFEAPPPERLDAEMDGFFAWLNGPAMGLPAMLRAALAHLRFETIHPYEDGDGRIGRMICEQILAASAPFAGAPFSLSRTILARRTEYYAALQRAQRVAAGADAGEALDATDFARWFLEALEAALVEARAGAMLLTRRNRFFERWRGSFSPRQEAVLRRLFAEGPERLEQGLSTKPYARLAAVSPVTAARDLADLAEKGAVLRGPEGGRSVRYKILA